MGYFEDLFQELSSARMTYESLEGDWDARARAKDRLHALRAQIAVYRQAR